MWRTVVVVVAALCAPGLTEAKEQALLQPSGPWIMNYADDSCHLGRTFGAGNDAITVEFRQFSPSESFELLVAGRTPALKRLSAVETEFGPGGEAEQHPNALRAELSDGRFVIETTARLLPEEKGRKGGRLARQWADVAPLKFDPEAEAKITQLRVGPRSGGLAFHLGPMDKPMDAMRACLDELLTHWGIDAAAHHSLIRRAVPTSNPGGWLTTSDYPSDMLRKGRSGVVHFRLMVDAQGKPSACIVQTGGSEFDKLTCTLLMKRARFLPALDAQGNAIASYFSSNVVWLT